MDALVGGAGATVLEAHGHRIGTVEHLLAALVGSGITDARIEVEGEELPILDGSALPWCEALDQVGVVRGPEAEPLRVEEVVRVVQGASWAELGPAHGLEVEVRVDFDDPALPVGQASLRVEGDRFRDEVAWARTFVLERDIARHHAAGRGRGATEENTVVIGPGGPLRPLRGPDEVVRHKLLDAVGDLALAGAPLWGRLVVHRGSHALHHALLREWRARIRA